MKPTFDRLCRRNSCWNREARSVHTPKWQNVHRKKSQRHCECQSDGLEALAMETFVVRLEQGMVDPPRGGRARRVGSAKSCCTPAELNAVGLDVPLLWSFDDQSIPYHLPLKTKVLCRLFLLS
jgi:hypothetical protein